MKKQHKNWFRRHWIISIFLGFIVLGMIGSIFDSGDKSDITGEVVNEQIEQVEGCIHNWECSDWSECSVAGIQKRICTDSNNCGTVENKPSETETCEYEIQQTQSDTESETNSEEDHSFDDWIDDLEEAMNELKETTNIYKKIDECTELCTGEDIDIPYIKNICHSDCYQIYYYAGEDALDEYIEELRSE